MAPGSASVLSEYTQTIQVSNATAAGTSTVIFQVRVNSISTPNTESNSN